jgi:electron transport complex protein RnfG
VKSILRPALTLFLIAGVLTAGLGLLRAVTEAPIAAQTAKTRQATMSAVLPQASEYIELPVELPDDIYAVFEGYAGGELVGYVFELYPAGYSGDVAMLVGISSRDNVVSGMRVMKHTETPGLGALAVKEFFYGQFTNKPLVELTVVKGSPGEYEIDAITSATITSRAVTRGVNAAIAWFNERHPA